ncbi:MAG TPA: tetratricopeptide repeat protein [Thermoanaerobaculia bacterium]|nr:tetratricopeptide repeat protein [Thermoanaerobaculia bacterium]
MPTSLRRPEVVALALAAGLGWFTVPAPACASAPFDAALAKAAATLGKLEERAGRLDEAQVLYEKAVELAPGDGSLHYLLGRVYLERYPAFARQSPVVAAAAVTRARSELQRATELAPNLVAAWILLGRALTFSSPPPAAAGAVLEHAHQLLPRNIDLVFELALFYTCAGERPKADLLLQQARADHAAAPAELARIDAAAAGLDYAAAERLIAARRLADAAPLYERAAAGARDPRVRASALSMLAQIRDELPRQRFRTAYGQARALAARGDVAGAIRELKALLAVPQDSIDADQARRLMTALEERRKAKGG